MDDDTLARARAVVAGLREAEGKATPGPWHVDDCACCGRDVDGNLAFSADPDGANHCGARDNFPDAAAIVALRNAAPALIRLAEAVGRLADEPAVLKMVGAVDVWYYSPHGPDDTARLRECYRAWRDADGWGRLSATLTALADLAALDGGEVVE